MSEHHKIESDALRLLIERLDGCRRYERGAGGMTIDAQIGRTELLGVKAGWVEEAREVLLPGGSEDTDGNEGMREREQLVAWLREPQRRSVPTMDPVWSAAFNACLDHVAKCIERGEHLTHPGQTHG